jgi:hypothetical protein
MMHLDPPTRAIARESFLFIPPERSLERVCLFYPNKTSVKMVSTSL